MKKIDFIAISFGLLALSACGVSLKDRELVKNKADSLLEKIALGTALNEFPVDKFPKEQSISFLSDLKNNCDFANRKGHFINDYIENINGQKRVNIIYEFYLKCDSARIIFCYNVNEKIELNGMRIEKLSTKNSMITKPERQLSY